MGNERGIHTLPRVCVCVCVCVCVWHGRGSRAAHLQLFAVSWSDRNTSGWSFFRQRVFKSNILFSLTCLIWCLRDEDAEAAQSRGHRGSSCQINSSSCSPVDYSHADVDIPPPSDSTGDSVLTAPWKASDVIPLSLCDIFKSLRHIYWTVRWKQNSWLCKSDYSDQFRTSYRFVSLQVLIYNVSSVNTIISWYRNILYPEIRL